MDCLSIDLATVIASLRHECAVKYKDRQHSYADLKKHILIIHHYIDHSALTKETKVVLCTRDPVHHCAGMLYATLIGVPYIPIDANVPDDRLNAILHVIGNDILVCCDPLTIGKFNPATANIVSTDALNFNQDIHNELQNIVPPSPLSPYHYILFTSGSTGVPKGAIVYRESFVNLTDWYGDLLLPDRHSNCLVVSSLSFDLTQKNLFLAFLKGCALHFVEDLVFEPDLIARQIKNENISWINCAPTAFYLIAEAATSGQLDSLDTVILGGEPINGAKLMQVRALGSKCRFINSYGPTECTDVVLYHEMSEADLTHQSIPLSQMLPRLDVALDVAQDGQGELILKGLCVGAGYIGQPELTQEKFYYDEKGTPCYRTGDIFRIDTNGDYHFISRKDDQIKLRGYRIELGEIEFALNSHPDISMSVAKLIDEEIVAFVLLTDKFPLKTDPGHHVKDAIMRHLKTKLPQYFHPSTLVFRDIFPLNKNGKIDRQSSIFSMMSPTGTQVTTYKGFSDPLFRSLLCMTGIDYPENPSQTSLDELGIDSIQKIKLLSLLNFISEKKHTINEIFSGQSLQDLHSLFNSPDYASYYFHCIKEGM